MKTEDSPRLRHGCASLFPSCSRRDQEPDRNEHCRGYLGYATAVVAVTSQVNGSTGRTELKLAMLAICKALTSTSILLDRRVFIGSGAWSSPKWHLQRGN